MAPDIRLIALDLDGTLLTSDKRLSDRNRAALARASARGVHIVPATGRIYRGFPEVIRALPFLRYAITANGASVYDIAEDAILYRAELPTDRAIEIMTWLDGQPVIYDCYMDDRGWMTQTMYDAMLEYAPDPSLIGYMRSIRQPVPDLKQFLLERRASVQKIQVFCKDTDTQARIMRSLPFDGLAVSTSVARNVEINRADANKGAAMLALARHLGLAREQVMAFGDGVNDISMLRDAGTGVAMGNADPAVRALADLVGADNDADGVAQVVEALL